MKNKSKKFVLAALAGLLILSPVQCAYPTAVHAAQVSSSNDSKLSELDIAPGTLSPAFSPDVLSYTAVVDAGVTTVSVRAIPRASGGTIASVEGARSLAPGTNTVKVTCSAPDNSYTVYSITVTVGGAADDPQGDMQPEQGADGQSELGTDNQAGQSGNGAGGKKAGKKSASGNASAIVAPIAADGTVTLNGAAYRLSSNFSYTSVTQDIPSAFGQGSVQIGGNSYPTFHCEANDIHLVYMENTDGNGSTGFYYYDEKQNAVERFKYTGIGENFVVFISSARAEVPSSYVETVLTLPSGKDVVAYENAASKQMKDYYLIYGINSDGSNGWYLYDNTQGTYMRYVETFTAQPEETEEEEPIERTVTLNKYNLQVEKYNKLKGNMVKAVSIFVIAFLLLIIIFTAIIFKSRDIREEVEPVGRRPKRAKNDADKARKPKEGPGKNSLAAGRVFEREATGPETKKITRKILPEPKAGVQAAAGEAKDRISSPEEIRRQVQQEQLAYEQQSSLKKKQLQKTQEQELQGRMAKEQELQAQRAREQEQQRVARQQSAYSREHEHAEAAGTQPLQRGLLKKEQPAGTTDSVQLAAEKMRQSVQFTHKGAVKTVQEERPAAYDPMDDWEVEDTMAKRKARKKKRGRMDEDVEIMDLNDL